MLGIIDYFLFISNIKHNNGAINDKNYLKNTSSQESMAREKKTHKSKQNEVGSRVLVFVLKFRYSKRELFLFI
jgi:hypothetical protein